MNGPIHRRRAKVFAACLIPLGSGGAAHAQATKLLEVHGAGEDELFGRTAFVGDVDGDGFDDFGVGAVRNDNANGIDAGAAYLYSGRTGEVLASWLGDGPTDTFGDTIARVGDTNGDGFDDIAVSATSWTQNGRNQYVRVFSGRFLRDGSLPAILLTIAPTKVGDFGVKLDAAGDVNGDGKDDLLVGCGFGLREAFVISGADGSTLLNLAVPGTSDLGVTVAGLLADVDGDGYPDFLVGSYRDTWSGRTQSGSVWLYSGGPPGTIGTLIDELHGDAAFDWFGFGLTRVGDLDGDGTSDFAVGATGQPDTRSLIAGYVRVYSGATRQEITTFLGENVGDFFGVEISAGDLDGDSFIDLVVSARHADHGTRGNTGSVTVFSGVDGSTLLQIHGHRAGDKIGRIDAGGDVNGDGFADLVVGTGHITVDGSDDVGAAYLLSGRSGLAGWNNYGVGLPGTLGVPRLELDVPPVLGVAVQVLIGNSAGAPTSGVMLVGGAPAQVPTPLGGDLLVAPTFFAPLCFGSGADLAFPAEVPFDTTLLGLQVYLQALEFDPGALRGVSFSAGLEVVLGGVDW